MSYAIGLKAIKRLVADGDSFAYHKAKLSEQLFKGEAERQAFVWVNDHVTKFQTLPKQETLFAKFPELVEVDCVEPPKYYLEKIASRFAYDTLSKANLASQELLKQNQENGDEAKQLLLKAINTITEVQYRHRIMDFGLEAKKMVLDQYHNIGDSIHPPAGFGWPYLDNMCGGAQAGDVISFIGRPAAGKSMFSLYIALHNWHALHHNVLFVSMEMSTLGVAQRAAAMYAHTPLTQLQIGGYSNSTFKLFAKGMDKAKEEPSHFYVVDGNLAATVEDVYQLCAQLGCTVMFLDGAYLLRHKDKRLGRYEKVHDNVEMMKRFSGDLEIPTFASWQFNREAAKLDKKKGQKPGVEHIGSSDAIGQVSSMVCGLSQDEGVETMQARTIELLKGRNGEIGKFNVHWDFVAMNFAEVSEAVVAPEKKQYEYL